MMRTSLTWSLPSRSAGWGDELRPSLFLRAASHPRMHSQAVDPDRDPAGGDETGGFRYEPPYRPRADDFEAVSIALGYGAIGKALQSSTSRRFLDLKLNPPPRTPRPNIIEHFDADTVLAPAANGDWFDLLGGKLQNLSHQIVLHCAKRFDGLVGAREPHAETRALRKKARGQVSGSLLTRPFSSWGVRHKRFLLRERSDPDTAQVISCLQRFKASGRE
ncbi:hypothetical protein EI171_02885 [Bradyrhizobium sp. LCT2]|uniref:hypothetical protein n=1 Tax=Bradyrhizobium sp. LCT2 TaxID=2493093 RepID=UPI0013743B9E|nr:hypothetical protein [Bradyrhizobium sp. LCT2]QHP66450.1 hypothetical protein EI171_02885 [Bradyrhizobium sp. LCT2]